MYCNLAAAALQIATFTPLKLKPKTMKLIGTTLCLMLASTALFGQETPAVIGPKDIKLQSDRLTPEVLWSMGRLGEYVVSPDGKKIAYTVSYYDMAQNKGNAEIYLMDIDGKNQRRLTQTAQGENSLAWKADGAKLAFLRGGRLFEMEMATQKVEAVTDEATEISGYSFSPKGDRILFAIETKVDKTAQETYPDLPKTDAMIYDQLMYRHWDTWEDGLYSHIYVANYSNGRASNLKDIMPGERWDSPLKPFGGMEEVAWSTDGQSIAYTCIKKVGKERSLTTNSDIYLYGIESGSTTNLTQGMMGYDKNPRFSPDGKKLAWLSMEQDGFEADQNRIFVMDIATGKKTNMFASWTYSAENLLWDRSSKNIYFNAYVQATAQVHRLDVEKGTITAITSGDYDYHGCALGNGVVITDRTQLTAPADIYSINLKSGVATQLTTINKGITDQLALPTFEKRWINTTDGKKMLTWVVVPPKFDAKKSYPGILYCQGGPQSPVSQNFSYRWNFALMASQGYVVILPNRRGTTGMGQEWTNQISKDHGGQEMRDLFAAVDSVKEESWLDDSRIGCVGPSYGGYSVYWMAGNHNKRFKAFVSHCGVFNSEMEFITTDELFFDNWEMGGPSWETNNAVAQKSFAQSPHRFVQNWDTPLLIFEGGRDFRIPYTQGMAAFNAAQLMNVPSKFVILPSENHWVLKPQNGILWQREFYSWLDKWLK